MNTNHPTLNMNRRMMEMYDAVTIDIVPEYHSTGWSWTPGDDRFTVNMIDAGFSFTVDQILGECGPLFRIMLTQDGAEDVEFLTENVHDACVIVHGIVDPEDETFAGQR